MDERRKKHGLPFGIAVVAIGGFLLYVASLPIACRLSIVSYRDQPVTVAPRIYTPVGWLIHRGGTSVQLAAKWYIGLAVPSGTTIFVPNGGNDIDGILPP